MSSDRRADGARGDRARGRASLTRAGETSARGARARERFGKEGMMNMTMRGDADAARRWG